MNVKFRKIEVDEATAAALETRAASVGLSVAELLAEMVTAEGMPTRLPSADLAALDHQWTAIKAGEPTVANEDVVRWLNTWGKTGFRPWKGR